MRTLPPVIVAVIVLVAACRTAPAPASSPSSVSSSGSARAPISPPTVATFQRGIDPRTAPPLPAVPLVDGPLEPKVVFPSANESIPVRDSNFIFGSVGNGHATLTINGAAVRVAPNGAFLAYLPVPPASAPRYELIVRNGADSAMLTVPVRVPPARPVLALDGPLVVDTSSVSPRGTILSLRDSESVRVSVRAPENATAWVQTNGNKQHLVNTGGTTFATDIPSVAMKNGAVLYVARDRDSVHFNLTKTTTRDSGAPIFVSLGEALSQADPDSTIIARPVPNGTYKWMFVPGTVVQTTGRNNDNIRVRLDGGLEVWVDSASVHTLPAGFPAPRRVIGSMAITPSAEWVDVLMPVSSPPPYLVEQTLNHITLTLYGTQASTDIIKFVQNDSLVRMVNWVPELTDRVRIDLELSQAPYGHLVMYEPGRGLILRIRRPPHVSLARPLDGLTITVDAGHPPGGAVGPTGLTEPVGVLPIANKLKDMLEARGAKVVMTRTSPEAVDLHQRSVVARRTNSNALVSIHLNAFGDGINPFPNVGTSTLFFHPQSEPLARLVQSGMMRELGLRDLGIHYQNIAIGRTTWMPSIICEGAFLMVPEQENAVRTPEFQERYARGVADGIEAYFRSLAKQ